MSTSDPKQPKRPRRRKASSADAPADEPPRVKAEGPADEPPRVQFEAELDDEATRAGSSPEPTAEQPADEVEPSPDDVEAEEAAADVMLEADEEAEEPAAAAPAPARRRRRRGAAATEEAAEEEAPPAPAPRRRRAARDPNLPPPVVRAHAKYVRSSARKARLVCDHIRGKTVDEARAILAHTPRAVARDWSKLLESAVANAEHNHELVGEDLYVKAVHADEGPTIKRFQPRAMGRATRIRKRTAHLTILLTPKE
jgi:ribosomal protein L22